MSSGETADFAEFHRWRLEKIIELTDRLSSAARPAWVFYLDENKNLQLGPSALKDTIDEQHATDPVGLEAIDILLKSRRHAAYTEIIGGFTLGIMDQARSLSEDEIKNISKPNPDTILLRCSDAGFIVHEFTDKDFGEEYEVSRTWVVANGLYDNPIDVENVSIDKEDDLLSERLSVYRIGSGFGVFRRVSPLEDELLNCLNRSARIGTENTDYQLHDAGFAALTGLPGAEQKIDELVIPDGDHNRERLIIDLRERLKMVRASRSIASNQGAPTEEQLDTVIEILEEMAGIEE